MRLQWTTKQLFFFRNTEEGLSWVDLGTLKKRKPLKCAGQLPSSILNNSHAFAVQVYDL